MLDNEDLCLTLWHLYNKQYRLGLKVVPSFRVWDMHGIAGHFTPLGGACVIEVDSGTFRSPAHLFTTIKHEMIHQLQWENGLPFGHGAFFRALERLVGA
jgi:hypothetical protein